LQFAGTLSHISADITSRPLMYSWPGHTT